MVVLGAALGASTLVVAVAYAAAVGIGGSDGGADLPELGQSIDGGDGESAATGPAGDPSADGDALAGGLSQADVVAADGGATSERGAEVVDAAAGDDVPDDTTPSSAADRAATSTTGAPSTGGPSTGTPSTTDGTDPTSTTSTTITTTTTPPDGSDGGVLAGLLDLLGLG